MDDELHPNGHAGIDIAAKPRVNVLVLASLAPPYAACVAGILVFSGVGAALGTMLVLLLVWGFVEVTSEYTDLLRARIDEEGVTLLPRRPSRLSRRALRFRWEEVLEVRRPFWGANRAKFGLVIRLSRPRKFWTLRALAANTALVAAAIGQNPQFIEALRRHVPAERIRPNALDAGCPSLSATRARVLALVVFCCAMGVGWGAMAVATGEQFIAAGMTAMVSLFIGVLVTILFVPAVSPALEIWTGILNALLLSMSMIMIGAILFPNGVPYAIAALGGGAGILLGIGLSLLLRNRLRAWGQIALVGILAMAGSAWGWFSVQDLTGVRVGDGSLSYIDPWTPQGDAFITIEPGWRETVKEPVNLCWHSSDLTEQSCAKLPPDSRVVAVGQRAALVVSRADENNTLWWAPRDAEPRAIGDAPGYAQTILSPNRRLTLIRPRNDECKTTSWQLCEIDEGNRLTLQPPVPPDSVSVAGLADDGTLLWLQGSRPRDKGDRSVSHRTPLPESGAFPRQGELYTTWTWNAYSSAPPVQVYAAATEWLDWRPSEEYGRIRVCRISESKPARIEYALLDTTRKPVEETPISKDDFERLSWPSQSPDGRFVVSTRNAKFSLFAPAFIRDTKTGEEWRVPHANTLWGLTMGPRWSPSSRTFLIETAETRLSSGLWRWKRSSDDAFEQTSAIYLVDMDRQ